MSINEQKIMLAVAQLQLARSDYELYQSGRNPTSLSGPQLIQKLSDAQRHLMTVALQYKPDKTAIPMPQQDLDALIQRNEERKQVKAGATPGPWLAEDAWDYLEDARQWYVVMSNSDSDSELLNQADAVYIAHARNDTPEDDIDQLLALIADLQAALSER